MSAVLSTKDWKKDVFSTVIHSASKSKWIRESSIIAMIFNSHMEINPSNDMKYSLGSDSR